MCWRGEISALQTQDLTFFPVALHSGRTEHAGKCVCATSLCRRQPGLLPASLHPRIFLLLPKMLQPLSSSTAAIMKWPQIISVTFLSIKNLRADCGVEQNSSYSLRKKNRTRGKGCVLQRLFKLTRFKRSQNTTAWTCNTSEKKNELSDCSQLCTATHIPPATNTLCSTSQGVLWGFLIH